ncbi:hypothetical protein JTB14_035822 [Gonioctena quinquepunctata]|nr:hypothetical protein JTB14_035822 [Gonioctena quinquepunctata]
MSQLYSNNSVRPTPKRNGYFTQAQLGSVRPIPVTPGHSQPGNSRKTPETPAEATPSVKIQSHLEKGLKNTDSDILFMGIHHPDESTKYSDVSNEDVEEFPPFQPRDTSTPNLDGTFDMDVDMRQERRTLFMRDAKHFQERSTKFIDGNNSKKSK